MSQFLKRNMLLREVDTPNVGVTPEVQPGQNLQGILWSAYMQGGDVIRLGPYTYHIQKTITIPENVTLVGVPRLTKLILQHTKGSTDYGPVVQLNTKSRIVDCYVDFRMAEAGTGLSDPFFKQGTATLVNDEGTEIDTGSSDNNATIILAGVRARAEGCVIPVGARRGIVSKANDCFILGNEIEAPTSTNDAIEVESGVTGNIIIGNWCENTGVIETGANNVVGDKDADDKLNYGNVT